MPGVRTKESPFTPGKPVPIEYFIARRKEIERLRRAIVQACRGRNENVFITGERGIGKSSLAGFIRHLAEKEHSFLGAHCFLGGVTELEGMMRVVFQRLLQEVSDTSIFEKLKTIFDKYIKGLTLFGMGVEFTKDRSELRTLVDNFLPALRKIADTIEGRKKGILLILDDLNGISDLPEFAPFLKSFVDELATSRDSLPLLLVLVGIPERRDDLIKHQPSVARIFDVIDLRPMDEGESEQFFDGMFRRQNMSVSSAAMSSMVRLSGGLPMLMHEVGDAVFWRDIDSSVDENDARFGIMQAAEDVGRKYLDPQVYRALRSQTYRSILRRMGKVPLGRDFRRKDILQKIPAREQKSFDNFLQRIKRIGIIGETEVRGEYRFANQLYHLYVWLEAYRAEKETRSPNRR